MAQMRLVLGRQAADIHPHREGQRLEGFFAARFSIIDLHRVFSLPGLLLSYHCAHPRLATSAWAPMSLTALQGSVAAWRNRGAYRLPGRIAMMSPCQQAYIQSAGHRQRREHETAGKLLASRSR